MISNVIFIVILTNKLAAGEVLYGNKLSSLLKKFSNNNSFCDLKINLLANLVSIDSSKYKGPTLAFNVPNESLKDLYAKIGGERTECKLENQAIKCKSEEAGEMPEHNTQSYQHLELKLDKNGDIIDLHAYKIQKRYLLNKELKMFEKKYSEFYCPPREHITKEKAINNFQGAKDQEHVFKESNKAKTDISLSK